MATRGVLGILIFLLISAFSEVSLAQSTSESLQLRNLRQQEREEMKRTKQEIEQGEYQSQDTQTQIPSAYQATDSSATMGEPFYGQKGAAITTSSEQTEIDPRYKEYSIQERERIEKFLGSLYSDGIQGYNPDAALNEDSGQEPALPMGPEQFIRHMQEKARAEAQKKSRKKEEAGKEKEAVGEHGQ